MLLEKNALFFTYVQVPVIYQLSDNEGLQIFYKDETSAFSSQLYLNETETDKLLKREGQISLIKVFLKKEKLR